MALCGMFACGSLSGRVPTNEPVYQPEPLGGGAMLSQALSPLPLYDCLLCVCVYAYALVCDLCVCVCVRVCACVCRRMVSIVLGVSPTRRWEREER